MEPSTHSFWADTDTQTHKKHTHIDRNITYTIHKTHSHIDAHTHARTYTHTRKNHTIAHLQQTQCAIHKTHAHIDTHIHTRKTTHTHRNQQSISITVKSNWKALVGGF